MDDLTPSFVQPVMPPVPLLVQLVRLCPLGALHHLSELTHVHPATSTKSELFQLHMKRPSLKSLSLRCPLLLVRTIPLPKISAAWADNRDDKEFLCFLL